MNDVALLPLEPLEAEKRRAHPRVAPSSEDWHCVTWRPAGSLPLFERWLKAGEAGKPRVPPKLKPRR